MVEYPTLLGYTCSRGYAHLGLGLRPLIITFSNCVKDQSDVDQI